MILIVSTSLRPASNSRVLAAEAGRVLEAAGQNVVLLDLRDKPLPLCDAGAAYDDPNVGTVRELVERADAVLLALPIYNYDTSAAAKNLIELTGGGWEDKVVGFFCAAGGQNSYMSVMPFANSLMLDFRCVIVPRFVYATGESFANGAIADASVRTRVAELALAAAKLGASVKVRTGAGMV